MFKKEISILVFIVLLPLYNLESQTLNELYKLSKQAREDGNFYLAENYLYNMLSYEDSLTARHKIAIYNRFGLLKRDLGKSKEALGYYKKAENICLKEFGEDYSLLSLIYNNMAISYSINGDSEKALEYYNISLNKIKDSSLPLKKKMYELSKLHQNIGIEYKSLNLFNNSIKHFRESERLKKMFLLDGLEKVYSGLARVYEKSNDFKNAEKYYLESIREWEKIEESIYKSANVYNDYSSLLLKLGRKKEAIKYFEIGHQIYLENYGLRHPLTANSFLTVGDFHMKAGQTELALKDYQKSIISNTKQFNDSAIFSLPQLSEVIADIQFQKSLKRKSGALYKYADEKKLKKEKIKILQACINTVELSLRHILTIRQGYLSKSSKLSITEDEKSCFSQAIKASLKLFELTKDEKYKKQAYTYAQKSKASLLREEILQNKAFAAILPDSIRQIKFDLESNIYSYKKLIFDENQEKDPNKEKINNWSHSLFKLNNEYEALVNRIKEKYDGYEKLTYKTEIVSIENLQKNLKNGETIIEYSLSSLSDSARRELFIFVITKNKVNYYRSFLDSTFMSGIAQVRKKMNKQEGFSSDIQEYNVLNKQLHHLYSTLFEPVKQYIDGKNIFVIPDEEIAYLSFDALQNEFSEQSVINYAAIPYLIYDYCFSYAYSSSLLFQEVPDEYKNEFVYAFAPNYTGEKISNSRLQFGKLENTEKEINSILSWFNGKALVGREANEKFFKSISNQSGIFHFAMHASAEQTNPDFSFLAITQEDDNEEDGVFYNYEIAMMNMKASMVVLSGCNTGDGVISSGEGVMSLTRNFILAGVPSIVYSLWEVQDETSVVIMDKFYEYLSNGLPKNEALWQAKLDYIKNVSPAMVNPYFWSGYIQSGNPAPVVKNTYLWHIVIALSVIILLLVIFILKTKKVKN